MGKTPAVLIIATALLALSGCGGGGAPGQKANPSPGQEKPGIKISWLGQSCFLDYIKSPIAPAELIP